jgi:hypothetical protein
VDDVGDLLHLATGAAEHLALGVHDIRQGESILYRFLHVDDGGDVGAAVADEHADTRFLHVLDGLAHLRLGPLPMVDVG